MSIPSIVSTGRRLIATTFLDRCIIADRSVIKDSRGGTQVTWTDRGGTQECRFVGLSEDAPSQESNQGFGVATAMWLAPLGTPVKKGDRLTNLQEGKTSKWIVTSRFTPPSALAVAERWGIREAESGEAG